MSAEIVLTKIAKLANEETANNGNNIVFSYRNKKWTLLDNYKDGARDLFKLIDDGKENIYFIFNRVII